MKEARTTRAFSILRLASQFSWARPFVMLPLSVAAKVALLNARLESGTKPAELARRMGIKPQEDF